MFIPLRVFEPNTTGTDWIVGDIHGCYSLLFEKLNEISFDKTKDRLFSVGDLIDRGPESLSCLRLIKESWFHAVIGNHESMLVNTVTEGAEGSNGNVWPQNGGSWYWDLGPTDRAEVYELAEDLLCTVPLVICINNPDPVYISHACPLSVYDEEIIHKYSEELIWDRRVIRNAMVSEKPFTNRTFHGHTILKKVYRTGKATWLDTGAYRTGNLTILKV